METTKLGKCICQIPVQLLSSHLDVLSHNRISHIHERAMRLILQCDEDFSYAELCNLTGERNICVQNIIILLKEMFKTVNI